MTLIRIISVHDGEEVRLEWFREGIRSEEMEAVDKNMYFIISPQC